MTNGLKYFIYGSGLVCLSLPLISAHENKSLKVESYDITSVRIPEAFEGTKLLFLSDLHNQEFGKDNRRLIQKIKDLNPDYILIGGDMLVGKKGEKMKVAYHFISELARNYEVICANGNHEYRVKIYRDIYGDSYEKYRDSLKKAGVSYLENSTICLQKNGESLFVTGLEIDRVYYKRGKKVPMPPSYLTEVLGKKKEEFQILLAHNPLYFPEYASWGADLVLSGHNHGGLVRVPFLGGVISPQLRIFTKYDAGEYTIGKSKMVLSRGLGTHTIPIRINNLPELSLIRLHRGKK